MRAEPKKQTTKRLALPCAGTATAGLPASQPATKKLPRGPSLDTLKADALRASASSRQVGVSEGRETFGFFPSGLEGVVIRWPTL